MEPIDFSDASIVKKYSEELSEEILNKLSFGDLIGGHDSVIYCPSKYEGEPGDCIRILLRDDLSDEVCLGCYPVKSTPWLVYSSDFIKGKNAPYDIVENAKRELAMLFSQMLSKAFFTQLSGKVIEGVDGHNTALEPISFVPGANSNDAIIEAVKRAKTNNMKPVKGLKNGALWVLFMSCTEENEALRKCAQENRLELRSDWGFPEGTAFLLGAQSLILQFGKGFSKDNFIKVRYETEGRKANLEGETVFGLKKAACNMREVAPVALKN